MVFLPSEPEKIHLEAVQSGAAVSESLLALVGSTANFILDNFVYYPFGVSGGVYSGLSSFPYTFAATMESIKYKSVIEKIEVFNEISGISGATEFRIEKQLAAGGAWTNIFSTNCTISNAASDNLFFTSTDVSAPSGVVLPALGTSSLEVNDKLRFVIVSAADQAQNIAVRVITRPVN